MTGYRHTQIGWALLAGLTGVALFGLVREATLFYLFIAVVTFVLFGTLTVSVNADAVTIRFGPGLIRRRLALQKIRSWRAVRTPWYYGWGLRLYPGGWLYNVSGLQGVELVLIDGRKVRVGTDEPDALVAALQHHAGARAPVTREEQAGLVQLRTRRLWIWRAAVVALVTVPLGTMVYASWQSPSVSVTAEQFTVQGAGFSAGIPIADITSVTLEDTLPDVGIRTRGFAFRGALRGRFRVDGLGAGDLFVTRQPPYVFIRAGERFAFVNFDDPERTRQLYYKLRSRIQ